MVSGLDLFSKCAIADSGIGEETDVMPEPPPVPDAGEEGGLDVAVRPDTPLVERTELVDFEEEVSAPDVLDDRTVCPTVFERLDCCAPDIPLVEEALSVVTDAVVLLEDVRPEVDAGLACDEELWR